MIYGRRTSGPCGGCKQGPQGRKGSVTPCAASTWNHKECFKQHLRNIKHQHLQTQLVRPLALHPTTHLTTTGLESNHRLSSLQHKHIEPTGITGYNQLALIKNLKQKQTLLYTPFTPSITTTPTFIHITHQLPNESDQSHSAHTISIQHSFPRTPRTACMMYLYYLLIFHKHLPYTHRYYLSQGTWENLVHPHLDPCYLTHLTEP